MHLIFFLFSFYILTNQNFGQCFPEQWTERPTHIVLNCQSLDDRLYQVKESPCRNRCLAISKGWFNPDTNDWNRQKIVDDLGADIYNYCRFDLDRKNTFSCLFANQGWKCLTESNENIQETLKNLSECADHLNATAQQLKSYLELPKHEVIPCLFQCFAEKLQLYSDDDQWILENWRKAFGPTKNDHFQPDLCQSGYKEIQTLPKCNRTYNEYKCWELTNYQNENQNPSQSSFL